jgi:hypothetical protein
MSHPIAERAFGHSRHERLRQQYDRALALDGLHDQTLPHRIKHDLGGVMEV